MMAPDVERILVRGLQEALGTGVLVFAATPLRFDPFAQPYVELHALTGVAVGGDWSRWDVAVEVVARGYEASRELAYQVRDVLLELQGFAHLGGVGVSDSNLPTRTTNYASPSPGTAGNYYQWSAAYVVDAHTD